MDILVAPVSGCRFINQVASLYALAEHKYRPKIALGASGGVVSTSLYIAGNYTRSGLLRSLRYINSTIFVSSWTPASIDFIPSWVVGFFQGSLFKHSLIYKDWVNHILTPAMISEIELWILVYNAEKNAAEVFCTTSEDQAYIKLSTGTRHMMDQMLTRTIKLNYMDGDMDTYTDAAIASASIPAIVPPKTIKGQYYQDGGIIYASPFTPLRSQLDAIPSYHMIYLSGTDLAAECPSFVEDDTIINSANRSTDAFIRSHLIQDRYLCYVMLENKGKVHSVEDMTLEEYFYRRKEWMYSFMEMYPKVDRHITIYDFTGEEACNAMLDQVKNIGTRVWYVLQEEAEI